MLHRVEFRKEQFQQKLQMREAKEKEKQKDDKEKEERLQALRNQVHTRETVGHLVTKNLIYCPS